MELAPLNAAYFPVCRPLVGDILQNFITEKHLLFVISYLADACRQGGDKAAFHD